MFLLTTFQDIIKVPASQLGAPIEEELANIINLRLANKVVHNVGLVICLKDVIDVGESHVHTGDGAIYTKCTFRMVVFRPQVGEVLCGTLRSSSKEGLNISLGFFDSIIVPPQYLNEPSKFDETDQTWTWNYEDEGNTHVLRLEIGETIRFRVHNEEFVDVSPTGPTSVVGNSTALQVAKATDSDRKEIPYTIVGSICESGLGLVKWWS
uniref:DNA-directed RNA polymerase III subunit RPC8 n=1 Tax=Aceria tosichella TaxID=561515 RepID=A0A6G1SEP4_9ACAR